MIGAPIGVPPSAMPTRSAITLPRIAGSVESCMMLFVPLVRVRVAALSAAEYPRSSPRVVACLRRTRSMMPRCNCPEMLCLNLARLRLNDDNHLQAAMIFGDVVFQGRGIAAFSCGIVDKADKSLAILV